MPAPASSPVTARYDGVSRAFHWITVMLVLGTAALGLWIGHAAPAEEGFKLRLYNIHESLGVTVWVFTLARLAWRAAHPAPPLPAGLGPVLRTVARANHVAFYLWLLTMPVVGFVATLAWGFPLVWFGLLPLPDPVGTNLPLAEWLTTLHRLMAWSLFAMILLHAGAALWHGFVRRDGTLARML